MKTMPSLSNGSTGNNLLMALRADDWAILRPVLEEWSAPPGTILYEPGDNVRFAYFPRNESLISYLVVLQDGKAIETAIVGCEGAVGGIVSEGRLPSYSRAQVQIGGSFFRVSLNNLEAAKARSATLRNLFARYADCLMAQIFQSVACNAAHSIEQRTAKWLMAAIDRTGDPDLPLTQEQLAAMLGVGRPYISRVIIHLRERSILETRRGHIRAQNLAALEALSCECNISVRSHFDEVLKGVYPITSSLRETPETFQNEAAELR